MSLHDAPVMNEVVACAGIATPKTASREITRKTKLAICFTIIH